MRAKIARREKPDAIRKKIEEQEAKNVHALKELSKKRNEFPVMLYMNFTLSQTEEAPPFSCFYYSILFKTTAYMLWLMSGNYLRTWLIKSFCKPHGVEDCKDTAAASILGFSIIPHIIL